MNILTTELHVKGLTLKNRLVMPPMASGNTPDGLVNDALLRYYEERARGGFIGLIITEHCYVHPAGKAHASQMSIAEDSVIPGLKRLVSTIHACGTPVFAQLNHAGGRTCADVTGFEAVAPSAIALPRAKEGHPIAREMTQQDIVLLAKDFAAAAARAKEAGYDGVEIHSAHSYLLNQFLSPLSNHRTDAYGGALEGRLRAHLEITAAVRQAVGEDFPIALRMAACDGMDGGITPEDAAAAAKLLEKAGIDLLDISGGFNGYTLPGHREPGYFAPLSAKIKDAVSIPVLVTGGITRADDAEALLSVGKADLIGVGRALFKDARWAEKSIAPLQM